MLLLLIYLQPSVDTKRVPKNWIKIFCLTLTQIDKLKILIPMFLLLANFHQNWPEKCDFNLYKGFFFHGKKMTQIPQILKIFYY
jgi:hypothetical protein